MRLSSAILVALCACGARSALDAYDAASDVGVDASLDVAEEPDAPDANASIDAAEAGCAFDAAPPVVAIVRAGFDHVCAALPSGVVKCWGDNSQGELGNGTFTSSDAAVTVTGLNDVVDIASGYRHSCAALRDGSVSCWGYNPAHEVSPSVETAIATPTTVNGLSGAATAVIAGDAFSCARLACGTTECWGTVLNEPDPTAFETPTLVPALGNWVQAVVDSNGNNLQVLVRDAFGAVTCWDSVGTFAADCKSPPKTNLGLGTDIVDMGFLSNYPTGAATCIVTSSHALVCTSDSPLAPDGGPLALSPMTRMKMSWNAACSLTTSGTVECWYPTDGYYNLPLRHITGITDALDITVTANGLHGCAPLSSGHVACWLNYLGTFQSTLVDGIP